MIGEVVLDVKDVVVEVEETRVLDGVSFEVVDRVREGRTTGQIVALLGPSGIGKSTLLRVLAGLTSPDAGMVRGYEGRAFTSHDVGIVFQDYPLLSHRTVEDNLVLAGRVGGMDRDRARDRAKDLLARVGLEDRATYWPAQLSGGQRQRAAIAQQLVLPRRLLLLDEPFSGLDPVAIGEVSGLVHEVADEHELNTVLLVTHDIRAALGVSDTVLLMGRGDDHGARIADTYDLVDLGLAWGADTRGLGDLARAVEARFRTL